MTLTNPKTKFILAHAFGINFQQLGSLALEPEVSHNLYADLSFIVNYFLDSPDRASLLWNLKKFGVDRLFFGSDYPVFKPRITLAAIRNYPFSNKELRGILGKNLEDFLKQFEAKI